MRVLLVGGSGAIGRRLVPQLRQRGHDVVATARSPERAERLQALGAEPVVLDLLDGAAVRAAVATASPDAIVHQATALTGLTDLSAFKHFDRSFAATNRLRTEGTDILLAAARDVGVRRVVAQSFAGHRYARDDGRVKTEDDPLDAEPVPAMRETLAAMAHLDQAVTDAGGIALRYGNFYGDAGDPLVEAVRTRQFPIIGKGSGVWSFIHLDDAAAVTALALDRDGPAVYNIVDDEPAPTSVWVPELARILGVPAPRRFPRGLARIYAGAAPVVMGTESRGASNARAKSELGWSLHYRTWRDGFVRAYG